MNNPNPCEICQQLRPLVDHLFELGLYCELLGNSVPYADDEDNENNRIVKTSVIGQWLKLAGQLEKVNVNTWSFADESAMWCGTAADLENSNSKHLSDYSTSLTRFIFVMNALEETYRFVAKNYNDYTTTMQIAKTKRLRRPSIKAAFLTNDLSDIYKPLHFDHVQKNFRVLFFNYQDIYRAQLTGLHNTDPKSSSFGLHLLRNLRNHVAHGIFPLIDNPEYFGLEEDKKLIINLLLYSCRVAALYIQVFMRISNQKFNSYEYSQMEDAYGEEFEYFVSNCTIGYASSLHLKGDFSVNNPYPYT